MKSTLIAKFEGDMADSHVIPAYAAINSLYGIARANMLLLQFLSDGKIKRKNFDSKAYELNLVTQRPGSFETVFELLVRPEMMTVYVGLGVGVGANFFTDFLKTIFSRSVGNDTQTTVDQFERESKISSGDLAALVEAIQPAIKASQNAIGSGAKSINLSINGSHNIVNLDNETKDYVFNSIINKNPRAKEFSIGSFNANSQEGRAFDTDLGKLVTFDLSPSLDELSMRLILDSISKYALAKFEDLNSRVAVRFTSIDAPDGSIKKMRFHQVRRTFDELDQSRYLGPNS